LLFKNLQKNSELLFPVDKPALEFLRHSKKFPKYFGEFDRLPPPESCVFFSGAYYPACQYICKNFFQVVHFGGPNAKMCSFNLRLVATVCVAPTVVLFFWRILRGACQYADFFLQMGAFGCNNKKCGFQLFFLAATVRLIQI